MVGFFVENGLQLAKWPLFGWLSTFIDYRVSFDQHLFIFLDVFNQTNISRVQLILQLSGNVINDDFPIPFELADDILDPNDLNLISILPIQLYLADIWVNGVAHELTLCNLPLKVLHRQVKKVPAHLTFSLEEMLEHLFLRGILEDVCDFVQIVRHLSGLSHYWVRVGQKVRWRVLVIRMVSREGIWVRWFCIAERDEAEHWRFFTWKVISYITLRFIWGRFFVGFERNQAAFGSWCCI